MKQKNNQVWFEKVALLPLFTSSSALLASQFWGPSPPQALTSSWVLYSGLVCLLISLGFALHKSLPTRYAYDIFLLGTLCIWMVYWQKEYTFEAPVFRLFTAYYVFINVLFGFFANASALDADQYELLSFLTKRFLFFPGLLAILTLFGLYWQERYLLYPIFATLLMIRLLLSLLGKNRPS